MVAPNRPPTASKDVQVTVELVTVELLLVMLVTVVVVMVPHANKHRHTGYKPTCWATFVAQNQAFRRGNTDRAAPEDGNRGRQILLVMPTKLRIHRR